MPNTDRLELGITAFRDPNTGAWDVRTVKVQSREGLSRQEMITTAQSILEKSIYMLQEESRENQNENIIPSIEDPAEFVQPKRPRLDGTSPKHPIVIEDDQNEREDEDGRRSPSFSPHYPPQAYNILEPDPNPILDQKTSPSEEPSTMAYGARRRTTLSGEPSVIAYVANQMPWLTPPGDMIVPWGGGWAHEVIGFNGDRGGAEEKSDTRFP